jgi:hypothetical protein
MKKAEYYESTLKDLKKELVRQKDLINSLNDMHNQLACQGYEPLDPLDDVISEWETRRSYTKGAIKRLEELVK